MVTAWLDGNLAREMVEACWHFDLDEITVAVDPQVETPRGTLPPKEGDLSKDRTARVADDIDVMRPQEELRRPVGDIPRLEIERMFIEPEFAGIDTHRRAGRCHSYYRRH